MGRAKQNLFKVGFYHNEDGKGVFKQSNNYLADTPEEGKEKVKDRVKYELGKVLVDELLKAGKPLVVSLNEDTLKEEYFIEPERDQEHYILEFILYKLIKQRGDN